MNTRDWKIYYTPGFKNQYEDLHKTVLKLKDRNPKGYKSNPVTKLLLAVHKAVNVDVPANPQHPKFNLGNTIGPKYRAWKRVKKGMPSRYRLFFRFSSSDRSIIFSWLNDEFNMRKEGDKHDVYRAFERLLDRGEIPNEYSALLETSTCLCPD